MNQNVVSTSKHKQNFTEAFFFSYPLRITNVLEIFLKLTKKVKYKEYITIKIAVLFFLFLIPLEE